VKVLHISRDLQLPLDYVTQTAAIIARKRRGKTYTGSVIAEELVKNGLPFVVLDVTGAWWGLRASADGKRPGLPVTIIGGEHGDVPLERGAGRVIAELVVDHPGYYVLDLSDFDPADMHVFLADFGERLFALKKKKRFPMHILGDEADMWVPQVAEGKEHARAGRAYDKIVRQGGLYGIGITLITQRPALVSKNTLSQVELLVVLQLIAEQDRAPVERWVRTHDTGKRAAEFMESLASLGLGEAWFWSPAWLNIFKRVQVRQRDTFNSSKTPEVGDQLVTPKVLAAVDIAALKERVAATIERAKADDPAVLRAKLGELQRQLAERPTAQPQLVEIPVVLAKDIAALSELGENLRAQSVDVAQYVEHLGLIAKKILEAANELTRAVVAAKPQGAPGIRQVAAPPVGGFACLKESIRVEKPLSGDLSRGEHAVLTVVAQHLGQGGATREQITVLTGYKRSSRDKFLQLLGAGGYVEAIGDSFRPTEAGLAALGDDFQPLPTGPELRQYWQGKLTGGERQIFDIVVKGYPKAIGREDISAATSYQRSSRDKFLQLLAARKLLEPVGRGAVRASRILFSGEESK
jgi:hypothetical protein